MDFLGALRDLGAFAASLMVIYGVNTWRRDFIGKRRIEMAEDTLCLFFRARDALVAMRSPMSYAGESAHIIDNGNESRAKFNARTIVAPLYKRHENHTDLFASLQSTRYQFMARFGQRAGKPFEDLRQLVHEVLLAGHMLIMIADFDLDADDAEARKMSIEQRQSYEKVIWDHAPDDAINMRLTAIVASIEAICRKTIDAQPCWASQWRRIVSSKSENSPWGRICGYISSWSIK